MLTVEEALHAVLSRAGPLSARRRRLALAVGCTLAEDVRADLDSPPFRKALVDGYALRSADLRRLGGRLTLGEEIPAGKLPGRPLAVGEAALVMTGAPIPEGADAIVMREQARPAPGAVHFDAAEAVEPGQNWMPVGREMRAGEVVLHRGERLNAARIGLLASVGRAEVAVIPRPRVVVVPTGDELVEPTNVPGPGLIRNSNAAMLQALAASLGAEVARMPIAPDEPRALRAILARGLDTADLLLVAGGVSAGDRDLVPAALESLGNGQVFHKVRLKPGKPLWFGVGPARGDGPEPLVFGLPGNPVGALVAALLFVGPAIDSLRGLASEPARMIEAQLAGPFRHRGERPTYHPSILREDRPPRAEPLEWAGSADLRTVAKADGFTIFPAGDREYVGGEPIGFLPMVVGP